MAIAVASLWLVTARAVPAATLWSTNTGTDSATCGAKATPCRSISQSINNAADGDTIMVGPGRYGDLTGDGTFSHPGDEQPQPSAGMYRIFQTGCIVCITKSLHIYSSLGAAMTIIEASSSAPAPSTVMILHDGVDFGSQDHGFTITGGNASGLTIEALAGAAGALILKQNVTVKGNVDIGDATGFQYGGILMSPMEWQACAYDPCSFHITISLVGNRAIDNATGFSFTENQQYTPVSVLNNEAIGAGVGFAIAPGWELNGVTPQIYAGAFQLSGNVATHGTIGFSADAPGEFKYNTAVDNSQAGFVVTPGGAHFRDNTALSNGGPGVVLNASPDQFTPVATFAFASFDYNNFVGNDRRRPDASYGFAFVSLDPGPSAHCGILNLGAVAALGGPGQVTPVPATSLKAATNYWGSPNGPSSSGPGDTAGSVCDQNHATTTVKPVLPGPASMTGIMPPMP